MPLNRPQLKKGCFSAFESLKLCLITRAKEVAAASHARVSTRPNESIVSASIGVISGLSIVNGWKEGRQAAEWVGLRTWEAEGGAIVASGDFLS